MQLTEHFKDSELGVAGCDENLIANAVFICEKLLEPIRAEFGPVSVHDAYRDPAHNQRVGGKQHSWHLFQGSQSAADIDAFPSPFQDVFDWIRLKSKLPFDKVILEHNSAGQPRCVHLQIDRLIASRRFAYVGSTGAGQNYIQVEVK